MTNIDAAKKHGKEDNKRIVEEREAIKMGTKMKDGWSYLKVNERKAKKKKTPSHKRKSTRFYENR